MNDYLTDEEVERFISKYGEIYRKWVLGALAFSREKGYNLPPFTEPGDIGKIQELKYLFGLKKRARPT